MLKNKGNFQIPNSLPLSLSLTILIPVFVLTHDFLFKIICRQFVCSFLHQQKKTHYKDKILIGWNVAIGYFSDENFIHELSWEKSPGGCFHCASWQFHRTKHVFQRDETMKHVVLILYSCVEGSSGFPRKHARFEAIFQAITRCCQRENWDLFRNFKENATTRYGASVWRGDGVVWWLRVVLVIGGKDRWKF